jgi:hypothetical protein
VAANGEIMIVEIKSSVADFRSDQKWPEYCAYCDRLYFAVDAAFPVDILPQAPGLILADRYGGCVMREAQSHPLAPARRKALLLTFARTAATRLLSVRDPDISISEF